LLTTLICADLIVATVFVWVKLGCVLNAGRNGDYANLLC
jgi:hypothetical protein